MVPVKLFMLEGEVGNQGKHHQRDALLNHLQLYQRERATVTHKAQPVGRHLTTILEEGDHPREGNHQIEGPIGRDT